jgi:leucine dehydrogenase
MDLIRGYFQGVFGCTENFGGHGDPGPYTALGVFSGIQASCEYVFDSSDLSDRLVIVQGAGSVGEPLIGYLLDAGANVRFSEVDSDRIEKIEAQFEVDHLDPMAVYQEPCDVFAPCATGGILNSETISMLQCSIVAGGANNQLDRPEDADALRERGILYAPDFIINAGGALYLVSIENMDWSDQEARQDILMFGDTLTHIYCTADDLGINTSQAAEQLARERIQAAGQAEL